MSDELPWLIDRARIRELTARYNRCFDDGDPDGFAACFTEDGVMEIADGPSTAGRPALAEMVRRTPWGVMHVTADATVEVDGDRATQVVTIVVLQRAKDDQRPTRLTSSGRYVDELVRTDDGWRFARRRVTIDGWGDVAAVAMLVDHLRAMAAAYGDRRAYEVLDDDAMTFAEWDRASNALARGLVGLGVAKGDRVAIYVGADEALRWMVAYAAVHKAGAVAVPTNTRLAPPELRRIFGHAEVRAVLAGADLAAAARGPAPDGALVLAADGRGPRHAWDGVADPDDAPIQVDTGPDDLADILYTSGTTGSPKGVAIRHRNAALIPGEPNPSYSGKCWMHASPLFTFAGIGFIFNPMQLGLFGVYQPRFDADRWFDAVEEFRPMAVFLVPAMAQLVVAHPRVATTDLSSLQICAIGSAPLPPATLRALQERMPEAAVSNSYGMTEAGAAYCAMPKGEALVRIGSVGRPVPPFECRIVDDEAGELATGEVGEILIRLQGRQREYYKDPDATASTWRDGWLHSGDLGKLDEDGYLYIVGRKKDVIIRGGNNIHALDVESVLHDHPDVLEAAVVGIPHEVLGEDVAAFVVLRAGATATADDLRAHAAATLADYKTPRRIEIVTELPRNATGKVLKAQLVESFRTSGDVAR